MITILLLWVVGVLAIVAFIRGASIRSNGGDQ